VFAWWAPAGAAWNRTLCCHKYKRKIKVPGALTRLTRWLGDVDKGGTRAARTLESITVENTISRRSVQDPEDLVLYA
jgi:hypothetical protein